MTAVKQRLVEMLPEVPNLIPKMPDDKVQQVIDLFITVKMEPEKDIDVSKRIGIAEGEFEAPEDFDANNDEVYAMIMESASRL